MGSITDSIFKKTTNSGLEKARTVPPPPAAPSIVVGPFEISINNSSTAKTYIGWTLSACSIRITNQPQPDKSVILKNKDITKGGQVVFRNTYTSPESDTLALTLPGNGTTVNFFIGGKFGSPSTEDQDGGIAVTDSTNAVLHQKTLMVRVRKNANNLTVRERDRFLEKYAELNASIAAYQAFLDSHNGAADPEIHRRSSFLPWHRAFMISMERHLQALDPTIAIPYWHFDQPSPNLFSPDFMGGTPNAVGRVTFSGTNPLRNWSILGVTGVTRAPSFNTATSGAAWDGGSGINPVLSESSTLALGSGFDRFQDMEDDPHDTAHSSFSTGPITLQATATRDPLFFLLHSNIDRLWAKWQLLNNRYDTNNSATYSTVSPRIGDFLPDTMWPWNGVMGSPRPPTAPGGPLVQLTFPSKPGPQPTVADVIDYIGKTQGNSCYFDYDDVPFI